MNIIGPKVHPFLRALVPEHREMVVQGAEERAFAAGEILFHEGQPANRFYLIEAGRLGLETHVHGKGEVPITSVGPGHAMGWSWLVPPYVWHFQGRAQEPARAVVLNGGHLLVASEQDHYLGYELMKNISKLILEVLLLTHQRWLETGHHPVVNLTGTAEKPAVPPHLPMELRIAEHPFFHGMHPEYLQTLAKLAITREYEPAQKVFDAGETADGLYVIESGRIMLEAPHTGANVPVQLIGSGHAIGWSSFCEPYEWQFNAQALDLSTVIFFRAAQVRERCAADYHLGYELTKRITRMMLQRLQATRDRMWQAFR